MRLFSVTAVLSAIMLFALGIARQPNHRPPQEVLLQKVRKEKMARPWC